MNHDGNRPATAENNDLTIVVPEHAAAVLALWRGSLGHTVRCVPSRQTLMARHHGRLLYAKRYGSTRGADREWRWLHKLAEAGFRVARPVGKVSSPAASIAIFGAVPGRSLDAWAVTARRQGWLPAWFDYAIAEVAPLIRRLHARGWVHRDLNCAHLFAVDPQRGGAPALIDVERVLQPRLRWQRWVVKDLASLLASSPVPVPVSVMARFLRAYAPGESAAARRRLGAAVGRKVARISRHRPRFG
ncbi:MAG: hypothetical protein CMJ88_04075 [Planctomycetes bacterium]|nr:hypothetical protein [Planctomycetota bacterium]